MIYAGVSSRNLRNHSNMFCTFFCADVPPTSYALPSKLQQNAPNGRRRRRRDACYCFWSSSSAGGLLFSSPLFRPHNRQIAITSTQLHNNKNKSMSSQHGCLRTPVVWLFLMWRSRRARVRSTRLQGNKRADVLSWGVGVRMFMST